MSELQQQDWQYYKGELAMYNKKTQNCRDENSVLEVKLKEKD